ncbi:MAG: alpha/beta hydrolase [Bifidobacteriaceae bacterium]|jgi:acetyl esterase/lipase|nr:alpha/beta hydrolase [Bifidobacteriaceae bacterium]
MQTFTQVITGSDGTQAQFSGYVIDNSPEVDMNRRRPAVLILPGGGYRFCSDREAEPIALKIVSFGYQAFILRYSCAPSTYPTALLETAEAMRTIREHAEEWHVDPNAITIAGFSAGGHLAASLATGWNREPVTDNPAYAHGEARPNGLYLGYPVITSGKLAHRGSFDLLLGDRASNPALLERVSMEKQVSDDTPATFIWTTVTDETVPMRNTLMFVDALLEHGISVEAHLFPHGQHGLGLGTEETRAIDGRVEESVQAWPELFHAWMRRTFPTTF